MRRQEAPSCGLPGIVEEGPLVWRDSQFAFAQTSSDEIIAAETREDENITTLRAQIEYKMQGYAGLFIGQVPSDKPHVLSRKKTGMLEWSISETRPLTRISPVYDFRLQYNLGKKGNTANTAWMSIRSEHDRYFDDRWGGYERAHQPPIVGFAFRGGRINELWLSWTPANSTALDMLTRQPVTKALMAEASKSHEELVKKGEDLHSSAGSQRSTLGLRISPAETPILYVANSAIIYSYHRSMSGGESHNQTAVNEMVHFPFDADKNTFFLDADTAYRYSQFYYQRQPEKTGKVTALRDYAMKDDFLALLDDILGLVPAAPLPINYTGKPAR